MPNALGRGFFFISIVSEHIDTMEQEGDTVAANYWKKVETVPVLTCFPRSPHARMQLSIPELYSTVYCNDDRTLTTVPEDVLKL